MSRFPERMRLTLRASPDHVLSLATVVVFAAVAAVTMHFDFVARMSPGAFHVGVALAALLTFPVVTLALRAARTGRGVGPTLALAVAGGVVIAVTVSCTLAVAHEHTIFSFLDFRADSRDPLWLAMAVPLGAIPGLVAGVALVVLMRVLERAVPHSTLDGRERVAARLLGVAGLASSAASWILTPAEVHVTMVCSLLVVVALVATLGRDLARLALVKRVFAGADVALALDPRAHEGGALPLVSLGLPSAAIVARTEAHQYRTSARGGIVALVGETLEETCAPLRRRVAWTAATVAVISATALLRYAACITTAVALP